MADLAFKTCSACSQTLSIAFFSKQASYKDGYRGQCRKCRSRYTADYLKRAERPQRASKHVPEKCREGHLRRKYGMTHAAYEAMLEHQRCECAICYTKHTNQKPLVIDHCHESGVVRGLLCSRCNRGLGMMGDNADGLHKALRYLAMGTSRLG